MTSRDARAMQRGSGKRYAHACGRGRERCQLMDKPLVPFAVVVDGILWNQLPSAVRLLDFDLDGCRAWDAGTIFSWIVRLVPQVKARDT